MKKSPTLVLIFLEYVPGRADVPAEAEALEELLHHVVEVGRDRWPSLALSAEVFVRHLAQRLPEVREDISLEKALEKLHLADLYLACACVHGVPGAIQLLEQYCLAKLRGSLKQPASVIDDVCQTLRIQLLLGIGQSGPQLAVYKGKGSLPSWIRVIAVNMLLKQQAAPLPEKPDEHVFAALEALPTPGPGAELDLIKHRFRHDFRQALNETFAALTREQRNLLRFYFVDRLTTTALGDLFRVDQSTVSRWLKSTREAVYEDTKRRLQERLQLSTQEFKSLVDTIKSQFDLSLSQLLAEEEEQEG